jgi:hypothetical protein
MTSEEPGCWLYCDQLVLYLTILLLGEVLWQNEAAQQALHRQ